MSRKSISRGIAIIVAMLAGCQKSPEAPVAVTPPPPGPAVVQLVKETERSKSFMAVNEQLELGGTLYGYVDVDGDVLKLAAGLHDLLGEIAKVTPAVTPFAKQDYAAVAETLGLTDVKAVGVSSVPDGTGFFRNRMFFYTGGERHGLLLGLGGKPGPFTHLKYAPPDTAFYAEADVDVPVVYRTIKAVVTKVAGEPVGNQMEAALQKAGEAAALSILDLIHGLKGHASVVLRVNSQTTMKLPGPSGLTLPRFSLLICVDGVAPVLEKPLEKAPVFKRTDVGSLHVYELKEKTPLDGIQPVIVADGTTLFFASSREFLDECRGLQAGLAQSADFQRATTGIGVEGNGITYVNPQLFREIRKIETLNPSMPPQAKSVFGMVVSKLPTTDRPMAAIRTNLPNGILVRAYWDRSFKQQLAMVSVYNPVTIGALATMAIPAFQKVRTASQDKAVLNNLRQLAAAADRYYLENGVQTVSYGALVGPGKYVRRIVPVAGEDYRQLRFVQGKPLRLKMPDGRVIEYAP